VKYTALFAALLLTGCATQQTVTRDLNVQIALVEKAKAEAEKARYDAIAQIAATGGDSAKTAAVMALALAGRGGDSSSPRFVAPEAPETRCCANSTPPIYAATNPVKRLTKSGIGFAILLDSRR